MDSFQREYLGSVETKSGALRIQDALRTEGVNLSDVGAAKTLEGFSQGKNSLFIGTFFEDGKYSVFGRRNENGELISIEIVLDEPEKET